MELLPRREPARLRGPVRQRRARPRQPERPARLRLAEQGRAVAHRAIPGRARRIPFATVFPDFDPNREQDQQLWLLSLEWRQPWTSIWEHKLRVAAVDETLKLRDEPDPAHPFRPFPSDISTPADRGRVVPLRQDRAVEHDHARRGVPERGRRGEGELTGDDRLLGARPPGPGQTVRQPVPHRGRPVRRATACSRTRRRRAWRSPIS